MKKRRIIFVILMVFFSSIFSFSLYKVIEWKKSNDRNREIQKEIDEYIEIIDNEDTGITEDENLESIEDTNDNVSYNIDFESLKSINKDTSFYLKVNNTNINYIVVKGTDNSYYLKHNFNKEYNISGWIFAHYLNKLDGTDKNIVVFGHNTTDGTMFGTLRNVLSEDWDKNEDNRIITVINENGEVKYKVFSVYNIDVEDYYINTSFQSNEEYLNFLNTIKARSIFDFGIDLDENDKIITLSTCSDYGKKRVVLHAVRVKD